MRKRINSVVFWITCLCFPLPLSAQTESLNIFFTGDVQGNFEPCGCAGGPTGGIARRVGFCNHYINEKGGVALHVDAGNYFAEPGPDSAHINRYLKESLSQIPLTVLNLGSDDLYWWKDLSELDEPTIQFISTNLVPRRGNIVKPDRYAIVEIPAEKLGTVKPVRVGFLGLVDPRLVKPNSGFRAFDPLKSVRDIKPEIASQTDFIIVLWDLIRPQRRLNNSDIFKLAEEHNEIYAIITTEKRFVLYDPIQVHSSVILSSIERGRYLGLLGLNFTEKGEVESVQADFFEMHEDVPEDPVLASRERKISGMIRH